MYYKEEGILDDIKKYSDMGKLSIFVGAGISSLSGYPLWKEIIKALTQDLGYNGDINSEEALKVPQIYFNKHGEEKYVEKIKSFFSGNKKPNTIHDMILSLEPNHILTTNYDTLIEDAAIKFGRNFSVLNSKESFINADTGHYIVKVHGDLSGKFVLKEDDYLNYENDFIIIDNMVKNIFATDLVIFIGYSLNDYNIKLILNWVRRVQDSSFIKPVFINAEEPMSENELEYQNGRGLRILEEDSIERSKYKGELTKYYKYKNRAILKKIKKHEKSEDLTERVKKLDYLYRRVKGIKNVNYIRRKDFNHIFANDYTLDIDRKICNIEEDTIYNYIEDFFENKGEYFKLDKGKAEIIDRFFVNLKKDERIDSMALFSDFIGMREFVSKEYTDLGNNYKKAYYLAQLGEYEQSFTLYTGLLSKARQEGCWDIYYFSQINRMFVFQQSGSSMDSVYYLFEEDEGDFISKTYHEMQGKDIKKQFAELPNSFKLKYETLEEFTYLAVYSSQYYSFLEESLRINNSKGQKDSVVMGHYSFDNLKFDLIEKTKFLYENMILYEDIKENKVFIRNAYMIWLEAYYLKLKFIENHKPKVEIKYNLTLEDLILISSNFKKEDIQTMEKRINLYELPFSEAEAMEEYILKQIRACEEMFGKKTIKKTEISNAYSERLIKLIYLATYFLKSEEFKLEILKFVINIKKEGFDIAKRVGMVERILGDNPAKEEFKVIENWFIYEYMKLEFFEDEKNKINKLAIFIRNSAMQGKFEFNKIKMLVSTNPHHKEEIRALYPILDDETKEEFNRK